MDDKERRYALTWAGVVMLATCIPYGIAWFITPLETVFPGALFNSDDHGVYYAWMRQAADGKLLFRNLFTTEPQQGIYFQAYFLLLGQLAKIPGVSIPLADHLGRVVAGTATLYLVYRLAAFFSPDLAARRCAFWTTAVSAGLGWIWWRDTDIQAAPVDVWQPEAVTFASLYTNSLFAVSLALMLGVVIGLLRSEKEGMRHAVGAGVCGLILGNIHSYDVIHLAATWGAYLLVRTVVERRLPKSLLLHSVVAALIAAPSVAYMAWYYLNEPIFKARADTATLTPRFKSYLLGYGLLLPLAVAGALDLIRSREASARLGSARLFLVVWLPVALWLPYLPVAFQRKLIMGCHFPLALLAGFGLAWLAGRVQAGTRLRAAWVSAIVLGILAISNIRYMVRDVQLAFENVTSTGIHVAFWPEAVVATFEWMHRETPPDARLLTFPMNGVLAPYLSGRTVYSGHWGETPRFGETVPEVIRFYATASSAERREFLDRHGITHVLWSQMEERYLQGAAPGRARSLGLGDEAFLAVAFSRPGATLYRVIR